MPIPHLKRRTYGYVGQNPPRQAKQKQKKTRSATLCALLFLLMLPFRILGFSIKTLWKVLAYAWRKKPRLSQKTKHALGKKILWAGITLLVFGAIAGTILTIWATRDLPDPNRLTDRQVAQSTKIFDSTGTHLLYEIFTDKKRTIVELSDIPKDLVNGLIATEDKTFYEHIGVRPLSILRSIVYGLLPNHRVAGTSTITQQLVKNAILTNERTLTRKIREIIMSLRLEQKYTKDQILKIYFNEIPYGSTNYGVESAAQGYFGKHVSDLTLAESATLAGFPKSPSSYLKNPVALKNRRDFVLERMFEEGYITKEQKEKAQAEPIAIKQSFGNIQAPHFVMYVKEQLVERYGEQMVDQGGLKVITTLEWDKQHIAEKTIQDNETLLQKAGANNTALVSLDPKNGHILSMVGSRDFFNKDINGQFNVVTDGKRQPGSSFKPMIYSAAFEKGYTADTLLFDVLTNFAVSGKPYMPHNYDEKEHGIVTIRQALQGSLNIPAVETLYLVGVDAGITFAERMGYTTLSNGDFGLSLVLGGGEVTLLEHTSAYGILANSGIRHPPVSILKVENPDGDVLYEWRVDAGERVLDEKITDTMSDILSDDASRAYIFGSHGILTLPDRPVAAKTGTTNNFVDAWTMGYTPSLVTGVWSGNTDNTPMKQGSEGYKVSGQIWHIFMEEALKGTPIESFPPLPPNDAEKPILRGGTTGGITLLIDSVTGKIATSSTPEQYVIEKTFIPPHSILHYADTDNPRGPVPEHPELDPQYYIWEDAIRDWAKRKQAEDPNWHVSFEDPPTEKDDIHSFELLPTVEILSPEPNSVLLSRRLTPDIRVSAPRGVSRVIYQVDGKTTVTATNPPFNRDIDMRGIADGSHKLTVIAEDDIGNTRRAEVPLTLSAGAEQPGVAWAEPSYRYSTRDFPRLFFLRPFKPDQIQEVRIFADDGSSPKRLLGTMTDFSSLFQGQISFKWNEQPPPGIWKLTAQATNASGEALEGDTTIVEVGP